jgi:hypothetical protein
MIIDFFINWCFGIIPFCCEYFSSKLSHAVRLRTYIREAAGSNLCLGIYRS